MKIFQRVGGMTWCRMSKKTDVESERPERPIVIGQLRDYGGFN